MVTRERRFRGLARELDGTLERCFRDQLHLARKDIFQDRPEAKRLLSALRPGDGLIVWNLDRFGEKVLAILDVVEALNRDEIAIYIVDFEGLQLDFTAKSGETVVRILRAFDSFRRRLHTNKIRNALQFRKEFGLPYHGKPRFGHDTIYGRKKPPRKIVGYRRNDLVIGLIRQAWQRRYRQQEPLHSILRDYQEQGERAENGRPWTWHVLKRRVERYQELVEAGLEFTV